jgi:hypothetical protein
MVRGSHHVERHLAVVGCCSRTDAATTGRGSHTRADTKQRGSAAQGRDPRFAMSATDQTAPATGGCARPACRRQATEWRRSGQPHLGTMSDAGPSDDDRQLDGPPALGLLLNVLRSPRRRDSASIIVTVTRRPVATPSVSNRQRPARPAMLVETGGSSQASSPGRQDLPEEHLCGVHLCKGVTHQLSRSRIEATPFQWVPRTGTSPVVLLDHRRDVPVQPV